MAASKKTRRSSAKKATRKSTTARTTPRKAARSKAAKTKKGRELFRQRVPIEHSLAHIAQRQGRRARYRGTRKNEFDMRRGGAIQNIEAAQRKAA